MIETLLGFGWGAIALMALGALLIGIAKTSFGGLGAVAAALFALAMPAKESTAAILLLLLIGDVIGVSLYGRNVQWKLIWRLVPTIIPGLLLGWVFMRLVDDTTMQRTIGVILLVSVLIQVWQRRRRGAEPASSDQTSWPVAAGTGVAAGFTTMTANAAGPVMALYFLAVKLDKARFIGTNAVFFFLINLCKVPLQISLGLFTPTVFTLGVTMLPFLLLGAVLGVVAVRRVSQKGFDRIVMAASAISAFSLLIR
ncbi:sulfite exporter TauE/SafE family protein [Nigerium massiliense]|uniref:sulfite exporter TauE/SafE family protein n=1 Tax=Nigerium massiliense TaxID=1522317 RepID=UPI00058DD05F|nr:sulfite exporter TauE/SafE family protein [Nigerium massiliense]